MVDKSKHPLHTLIGKAMKVQGPDITKLREYLGEYDSDRVFDLKGLLPILNCKDIILGFIPKPEVEKPECEEGQEIEEVETTVEKSLLDQVADVIKEALPKCKLSIVEFERKENGSISIDYSKNDITQGALFLTDLGLFINEKDEILSFRCIHIPSSAKFSI